MKRYYSAHNVYANESSMGFSNTWDVKVWSSKMARDSHVYGCQDMASRAIPRSKVAEYAHDIAYGPFQGRAYRIEDLGHPGDGYLGTVVLSSDDNLQKLTQ